MKHGKGKNFSYLDANIGELNSLVGLKSKMPFIA